MKRKFDLSLLLICEGERWVAQCLEFDFAAQGKSMEKAVDCFAKSFAGQIAIDIKKGKQPLEDFSRAPVEYWNMFDTAEPLVKQKAL